MHHIGMAAGSRPGDASLVGGRWEPAACSGSNALFSRDRGPDASRRNGSRQVPAACKSDALLLRDDLLMHHIGMAVGRYQRHARVMHYFCGMLS
jgi:hypothetical protein